MDEFIQAARLKPVFGRERIEARVRELGSEIDAAYGCEALVAICVLKGAFVFFSDLMRAVKNPNVEIDFVRLSSYGMNSASSRHVIFNKDIETDILGKHVLVVEDIVDSGHTMRFLQEQLLARKPLSVAIATLVDKHERREAEVAVKFVGFSLPAGFIVGYGMDYAEHFRGLPEICEIMPLTCQSLSMGDVAWK